MSWLPVTVTSEPASEPVTLAEAKAQCRVTTSDHDGPLNSYITAARQLAEQFTGTRFVTQTLSLKASGFADLARLPAAPIQSITSVKYLDTEGVEQTLSTDVYEAELTGLTPSIRLKINQSWPSVRSVSDAVRVAAVAGYSTVPETIVHALLLQIATWFDDREVGDLSPGTAALLANYRVFA